jgi:hypothetical protein
MSVRASSHFMQLYEIVHSFVSCSSGFFFSKHKIHFSTFYFEVNKLLKKVECTYKYISWRMYLAEECFDTGMASMECIYAFFLNTLLSFVCNDVECVALCRFNVPQSTDLFFCKQITFFFNHFRQ